MEADKILNRPCLKIAAQLREQTRSPSNRILGPASLSITEFHSEPNRGFFQTRVSQIF